MKHRIALVAIVGLIGVSALAPAQAGKRPAPRAAATTPDQAFVAAHEAFARNDLPRFDAAAGPAREHALAEYLDFWRLRMRIQPPQPEADSGSADAEIRRFIDRHPGTLVADLMRRDWLLNLGRRGVWTTFDAEYPQWVLRDDDEVHCYASLGRIQRGEPAPPEARTRIFAVRKFGDGCGPLVDALARTGALTQADLFDRLLVALETNSADAVRRIGDLLSLDRTQVDTALAKPARALAGAPGREIGLIALSRLARNDAAAAAGQLRDGMGALRAADRDFAWSQVAAAGMRRLAPESLEWTRLALDARATDETWTWLARAALRAHDWTTLRAVIERMSESGRHEPTWAYWHARALRETGEAERADALLKSVAGQFSFYGQLAAEELGQLTVPPPHASGPTEAELDAPAGNPGFARAFRFYELGLRFEGNREWNFQLRGMGDRQLLAAAEWACRRQVLDRCVNTADRTEVEHDFRLRFVSPFLDELRPVAAERGLDPAWVYGLIRQESRFIMDARSWAGAQGLMQIMPATARWIARKLGERDFRVEDLHERPTNLRFGTFYLRSVLDDLEGSPVLASAAYNAGPNRSRSWRSALPQTVEGAIFAEIIPFSETRDYVKKVLSNAVFYAALFSGEPQSLKARLGSIVPQPSTPTQLP
ncbi:MAG TPA: transglycosylase SLT domain-containing protein [Burkholderiaceae bacterium]|jgi:soluble lytic murein transglycosylase|nr:transglycosylase SLT domain-containing protein [Burkholderiaceae bacterium]